MKEIECMRKNVKAIFVISILFIICVGLFGLANSKNRPARNRSDYGRVSNSEFKVDEISQPDNETNEVMENKIIEEDNSNLEEKTKEAAIQEDTTNTSNSSMNSATSNVPTSNELSDTEEIVLYATEQPLLDAETNTKEKTEKDQYIDRLNSIIVYYEEQWAQASDYSMLDMKELKNQEYRKWDDELNTIYQLIKKKLPEDKFILLRDEEREWITTRDEKAAVAASKYAGGSMEGFEYMAVMTELTKERTFELVDIYFQE